MSCLSQNSCYKYIKMYVHTFSALHPQSNVTWIVVVPGPVAVSSNSHTYPPTRLPTYLPTNLDSYLSTCLSTYLSTCLSTCRSTYVCTYLATHPLADPLTLGIYIFLAIYLPSYAPTDPRLPTYSYPPLRNHF